jgi:hypothetical protein
MPELTSVATISTNNRWMSGSVGYAAISAPAALKYNFQNLLITLHTLAREASRHRYPFKGN